MNNVPLRAALLLLCWTGLVSEVVAQTCDDRFRFKYSDGDTGCLTDFAVAEASAVGRLASVRRSIPGNGAYNIAMTPSSKACPAPAIVGLAMTRLDKPGQNNPENSTSARSARALSDCRSALEATKQVTSGCDCRITLEDGMSPLTRDEFASFVGARSGSASEK